ncbi:MAG: PPOX class F420-dependent oxidoreductase [Chloroflexota bacterium]
MKLVPSNFHDLLRPESKALLFLATVMPDGSPQATPVWFSADGDHILVNSAKGRVKDRNMRARPRVALVIQDPHDLYRYLQIRGRVVEIAEEGADEHINALSLKYDNEPWKKKAGETRVIYKILPEHVDAH